MNSDDLIKGAAFFGLSQLGIWTYLLFKFGLTHNYSSILFVVYLNPRAFLDQLLPSLLRYVFSCDFQSRTVTLNSKRRRIQKF